MPSGRGNGAVADDLYALGATILYLLQGHSPLAGLDDRSIVAAKIEKGSFAAMSGEARLPVGLMEPLRGLLMDDPQQRWTIEDLDLWVSGRRLSPKQAQPPKRARSEEHTSELQSLMRISYAVFCLKKNNTE